MMPTTFMERHPEFTAVAWDGSSESAAWIVDNFPGAVRQDDKILIRDSLDREQELPGGEWVVRDEASGTYSHMDGDEFARRYQPVS